MTALPFAPTKRPHPLLWPLLAAVLVVTWSSGFVGFRMATETAPTLLVLFWRNLLSGAILLPFALLIGPRISRRALVEQAIYGFLGMFLYLASFALAIGQRVPTGLVALISDLVPLAIAALSQPVLGHRLAPKQWLGMAVGVVGVVIVSAGSLSLGHAPLWAYLMPVAGMLVFAGVTVTQKRLGSVHLPSHQSLAIQCLTAAFCFGLVQGSVGTLTPPMEPHFITGMVWLVLSATFICYSTYYLALRLYPAAQVAAAVYLSPPVTMIWAWVMFGEALTLPMFAGLGVTFVGVWLVTTQAAESEKAM